MKCYVFEVFAIKILLLGVKCAYVMILNYNRFVYNFLVYVVSSVDIHQLQYNYFLALYVSCYSLSLLFCFILFK